MWAVGKARLCIRLASVLLWLEMWGSLAGAWTILMQLGTRVLFRSWSMRIPIPLLTLVQGLCVRGSLATAAGSIWLGSWSGPFPLFSLTKSKSWEEQLHLSWRWVGGVDSLKGLSIKSCRTEREITSCSLPSCLPWAQSWWSKSQPGAFLWRNLHLEVRSHQAALCK